jgi:UDP-N-acetylmuramyl pentapeptide phosphotransferase/UDP-N-acetylglucosamine-1-phosphate transferase
VARGDHPQRTPVYGGAMIIAAMILATVITAVGVPTAARVAVYLLCLAAALVGIVLTFRDYSRPRGR